MSASYDLHEEEDPFIISETPKLKGWALIKRLSIISVGLCCDAYFLFQMNIIIVILRSLYPNSEITLFESLIAGSILCGAVCGQLLFGYLGDKYGRLKMFIWTLVIMVVLSLISCFAFATEQQDESIYIWITIARFFLGVGIGGEYPLSATIIAECSEEQTRGRNMAIAFASQGIGNIFAPFLFHILIVAGTPLSYSWRISLIIPILPLLLTLPSRLAFAREEELLKEERAKITHHQQTQFNKDILFKNLHTLIGTSGTWFLFDVSFYGNALFSASVIGLLGLTNNSTPITSAISATEATLVIAAIGLPGYFAAVYFADKIGRKLLQIIGFAVTAVLFFLMGFLEKELIRFPSLFISIYGLTFFFGNCGPNATTYVLAAESFEKSIRSTAHGISAASGKMGALLGAFAFPPLVHRLGTAVIFIICSVIAVLGLLLTIFFIPKKPKMQDEIE